MPKFSLIAVVWMDSDQMETEVATQVDAELAEPAPRRGPSHRLAVTWLQMRAGELGYASPMYQAAANEKEYYLPYRP
jgi:hypothetical protein